MSSFYSILTNQSQDIQENTLIHDIQTHLAALLNARQYMVSTNHDYGLPDICSDITAQYSDKLLSVTRELIKRYEPRLTIVNMFCQNNKKAHNQIDLKVIARIEESTLIELNARVGSQRLNSVCVA
jgi:type VI secretion system lysozyme-like protein